LGPIFWCLLAAALFGASTPAAKTLVGEMGAPLLAGLLYAGAALAVLPRVATRSWANNPNRSNSLRLSGAVLFGGLLGPVLLLLGLNAAPAGAVSLWLTLETVATAALARCFFREHLGALGWSAVGLVVLASALLSSELHLGWAVVLVALACLCWGLDNNFTSQIDAYTPEQITLVKGAATALVLIPTGLWQGGRGDLPQIGVALVIGGLGYGLSLVLYVAGAQQLGATRSQLIFSSSPLFGLVPAWLLLGEPVGWFHAAAVVLMALAIGLLQRDSLSHCHTHHHRQLTHTHFHRHDDGHHDHDHDGVLLGPSVFGWHQHEHTHPEVTHRHPHRPDLHHRHEH
jgi:drug/metabolite transporter (DMT)-like permease